MKILVVDDSVVMRKVLTQMLEAHIPGGAAEIIHAADGKAALEQIARGGVDLILLDWQMPMLDGLGVVKNLRSSGSQTPIVMVTSVTARDKVMEAGKAGVNAYVEKPVQSERLWEVVRQFIK